MKNQEQTFLKKYWNLIFVILITLCAILALAFALSYFEKKDELIKIQNQYNKLFLEESTINSTLKKQTVRADSMNKILNRIGKYMPMAASLQYRDSVCSKLPYKTGTVIWLKPDSLKCVITSFVIKGSQWQHSVSYLVKDSSGKEKEISPEIIY